MPARAIFKTRKDSLFLTNSAAAWQFLQNLSQTDDSVMLALKSSVADGQPGGLEGVYNGSLLWVKLDA